MTRLLHYALLAAALMLIALPNLGSSTLWDMDEGVNAECTREMMETGTWIVPTYNYELRTAKPVMLYWLQRASYNLFGISEWSARLPSVCMMMLTIICIYELGRRLFDANTGLLAGLITTSNIEMVKLAIAATPDATFIAFNTLTLTLFYLGQRDGRRWWFVPTAMAAGLATLTKGPAGAALPGLVIFAYLAWSRQLLKLWDRRLIGAVIAFLLVAGPWYGFVTAETRGAYIRAFIGNENINRFNSSMENHKGPIYYYLIALILFFTPWSVLIGITFWRSYRISTRAAIVSERRTEMPSQNAGDALHYRFLFVWVLAYLAFFSIAATKLPNYIGPVYPALSLLTAAWLMNWIRASEQDWPMKVAIAALMLVGVVVASGLLIAGGTIPLSLKGLRVFPALGPWAVIGLIPVLGAIAMIVFLIRGQRPRVVKSLTITAVAFLASLTFPLSAIDDAKAAKTLVMESGAHQTADDIRLASLEYTQESMTFYAERRVERMKSPENALAMLAGPRTVYLFVPETLWQTMEAKAGPHRIAARKNDGFRKAEILAVTNEGAKR